MRPELAPGPRIIEAVRGGGGGGGRLGKVRLGGCSAACGTAAAGPAAACREQAGAVEYTSSSDHSPSECRVFHQNVPDCSRWLQIAPGIACAAPRGQAVRARTSSSRPPLGPRLRTGPYHTFRFTNHRKDSAHRSREEHLPASARIEDPIGRRCESEADSPIRSESDSDAACNATFLLGLNAACNATFRVAFRVVCARNRQAHDPSRCERDIRVDTRSESMLDPSRCEIRVDARSESMRDPSRCEIRVDARSESMRDPSRFPARR